MADMTAPDGYTPHDGGPMPVAFDVRVKFICRDLFRGQHWAINLPWRQTGEATDIIAYRVLP